MPTFKAFLPYGLLVLFLIVGKLLLADIGLPFTFITAQVFKLFNPGFAFLIAGLVTILFWRDRWKIFSSSIIKALLGAVSPFLIIVFMSSLVQIMTNSGQNYSGIPTAITLVAKMFETSLLPFFAPFVGAFGSFITGSATISNIMFGNFFSTAGHSLGFSVSTILSLGVVGAAAGNMIALADMLAAEAIVGVKNQERQILKGVFIPCATYLVLVGIIGILITHFI
jgi:lactate permease